MWIIYVECRVRQKINVIYDSDIVACCVVVVVVVVVGMHPLQHPPPRPPPPNSKTRDTVVA